jgi:hypothetical protein
LIPITTNTNTSSKIASLMRICGASKVEGKIALLVEWLIDLVSSPSVNVAIQTMVAREGYRLRYLAISNA